MKRKNTHPNPPKYLKELPDGIEVVGIKVKMPDGKAVTIFDILDREAWLLDDKKRMIRVPIDSPNDVFEWEVIEEPKKLKNNAGNRSNQKNPDHHKYQR